MNPVDNPYYPNATAFVKANPTNDVTYKPSGRRFQIDEMALYTVKDGKIVHEHFYYNPGNFGA